MRRCLLAAMTAALTLLPAVALAHPSFNPDEVGPDAPTDAVLVVPHGCSPDGGMPEDGGASLATIELALQLADGVTVEPGAVDGWDTSVADGVVTWTDAGGASTDVLEFPVTISVAPDAPGEFALSAFQQCDGDESIRWTADSDEYPAVHLAVEGAGGGVDPDTGGASEPDDHATDADDHESEPDDHESDAVDDHEDMGGEEGHDGVVTGDALPAGAQALAGERADSTATIIALVVAGLVVLLLISGLVAIRRERP